MLRLVAFLFLALLCLPTRALSAVKYVDPACPNNTTVYNPATHGCSGGSGTSYSTIANGITGMAGGDTLLIRAGTYVEAPILSSATAGSAATPTTIAGFSGETVTIRPTAPNGGGTAFWNYANYSLLDNLVIDGAAMTSGTNLVLFGEGSATPYHDIAIQNSEIKNLLQTSSACLTRAGTAQHTNFAYRNLKVHACGPLGIGIGNPGTHGIYVSDATTQIVNCEIYNTQTFGVQLYRTTSFGATTLTDNRIHHTQGTGLVFFNGAGSTIARNLIYMTGGDGLTASGYGNSGKIFNNVLYGNTGRGLNIGDLGGSNNPSNNNTIQNNILRANGGGDFGNNSTGTVMDHNTCQVTTGTQCLAGDPLFVNAAAGDFHLGTGSPAIDAGVSLAASCPSGMDCSFQGSAPDTGAYEGTGASPSGTTAVQVSFVYGPVDAQHAAATSATVLWRVGGGDWATYCQVPAPTVTCTGAALANGASYDFTVVPTNSTGTGPAASVVSLSLGTPAAGVPAAATNAAQPGGTP